MKKGIRNIVFDMGNVLLDYNPRMVVERYCRSEAEQELIMRELFLAPEWKMADRGLIRDAERYDIIRPRIPQEHWEALKNCCFHWDFCMQPLPGAREFVGECRKAGYGTYVLSNASDLFFTYFNNFSPLSDFDGAIVSCEEGIIKPDPEIFQRLLQRYHLKAEECFFIDDREDNVLAARSVGMQGHVFQNDYPALSRLLLED
jgi:putative hydrolase of the HAD superfamily